MSGKQPIERIRPVAPQVSILTSARALPAVDWSTGIAWSASGCTPSALWPRCPDSDDLKTLADGLGDLVATDPFLVYTGIECEYVLTQGGDRIQQAAEELTDVHTAWAVARALWLGEGLPTVADDNYGLPPTLRRVATDISIGGVDGPLDDVVAALLRAYEACTGGSGGAVLHIPSILITAALGGGDGGARVAVQEGNIYRGPLGSVISPGPGYPHDSSTQGANGYGPLVSAGPPEVYRGNGYDEAWVYVTGPIEYAVGPVTSVGTVEERHAPFRMNKYVEVAERQAIVRFDPCCVFAALATNTAGERS